MSRIIRAQRGTELQCLGWVQEAALRMLMNNLDPEVAERPEDLIVYGGRGKAARNWACFDALVSSLKRLKNNETLLVQSGKPVAILPSHEQAPRILIANSNLVGKWATWEHFDELEKKGLMMYGQMTAGSWIYIGSQGIVQGTYETFMSAARQHFQSDLTGRTVLSGGLGGMGGAQPLAAKMAGGVFIGVEVDPVRIQKRLDTGYLDRSVTTLDEALRLRDQAISKRQALSIGLHGNAADVFEECVRRKISFDLVTDQTSTHDMLYGYIPSGLTIQSAQELRGKDPQEYQKKANATVVRHVAAMIQLQSQGAHVFDYGNNIRARAQEAGLKNAFSFPGFVPAYIRPLFCEGAGPFRWVALSGDPEDIAVTDRELAALFPENTSLQRWLRLAKDFISFQGLPARICWLRHGEREKAGVLFNRLVAEKRVKAPLVIGRDHLDCGSVASPNRETENMRDGSDAVADWPILNALINAVNGASWVSFHHGGGVGMGYSLHSGMVIVADGTPEAEKRLRLVLNSDPATGVFRHADSGYPEALKTLKEHGLDAPMLNESNRT